jgi:hypothetical protein
MKTPKRNCDNCPAKNNSVRPYELSRGGDVVKRMMLCWPCARIAERLSAEAKEKQKAI